MEAGHKAGIFTIAVNTGPLDGQVLLDSGADLLLPSMQALCEAWDGLDLRNSNQQTTILSCKSYYLYPPNLIHCFHELEEVNHNEWFCTSDPIGSKLGSGGGTTWLLQACHQAFAPQESFNDWIGREKRILLHAGGQSRRLPSYGPSGKILTPIPIFSWERGQRLGQNLLSLQLRYTERIMQQAPASMNTLIASGDVYIRSEKPLQDIPMWTSYATAYG